MKIAIMTDAIYPFTIGGSEIRNHEIAKRLVKKGHHVDIYGGKFWEGKDDIEVDGVNIHGISKYGRLYNLSGKRKALQQLRLSMNSLKLVREDFDIIENASFVFLNCYSAKIISLIKKKPLIFLWQQYFGDYLKEYLGNFSGSIAKFLEFFSLRLTRYHIAVSRNVLRNLVSRGVKKENIALIYNGADVKEIKNTAQKEKRYDLIFAGRLNYQKNLALLVEAAKILKRKLKGFRICIVGEGEDKAHIMGLIKEYGLDENFVFLGKIIDKKELYEELRYGKIFILTSLLEGFPLTIIEANASGLPVITTKTKYYDVSDYIKNSENGIIVNPDPNELSKSIFYLLKNKKVREKMSKSAIQKAEDYDWDIIAEKTEKYYQKVLSEDEKAKGFGYNTSL